MNTALSVFAFNSHAVRCLDRGGEPWFVATDIAEVLGYRDAPNMVRMLDEDEKGTHNVSTLGGDQETAIISESGLYACILKSRRAEAQVFRKWVTGEVLPSIRKTGSYSRSEVPSRKEPLSLQHRADVLVSADRCFRAVMRSGRAAGLPVRAAIVRAREVTLNRTGLDILAELGVPEGGPVAEAGKKIAVSELAEKFVRHWLAGELPLPAQPVKSSQLEEAFRLWARERATPLPVADFHRAIAAAVDASGQRTRRACRYWSPEGAQEVRAVLPLVVNAPARMALMDFLAQCFALAEASLDEWRNRLEVRA
jgi:prophage antirepressor-like protein